MGDLTSLWAWLDPEVGVVEHDNNVVVLRNGIDLWIDFWGKAAEPHWAWCACLQSAADWYNGTPLPPIDGPRGFIGVDRGRQWFADHGLLAPDPQEGFLAFYQEHVGRVRKIHDNDHWLSLEGNEGDAIRLVERSRPELVGGFGVRHYQAVPTPQEDETVGIRIISYKGGAGDKTRQAQFAIVDGVLFSIPDGLDLQDLLNAPQVPGAGHDRYLELDQPLYDEVAKVAPKP